MSANDLTAYSEAPTKALIRQGIVVESSPSSSATCLACDAEHDEPVEFLAATDRSEARAYLLCPNVGRVEVDPEQLRRWRIDNAGIAALLAHQLRADGGAPSPSPADRLFRLGEIKVGGQQRQTFYAPGGLDDGTLQLISEWRMPLVLVATASSDLNAGSSVSMADICRLSDQGLELQWPALEHACSARSGPRPRREGRPQGKGVGSMLLCWMACHLAIDRFDSRQAFYNAAFAYLERHEERAPIREQLPRLVADAKRVRGADGPCRYQRCKAGIPPDLVTD